MKKLNRIGLFAVFIIFVAYIALAGCSAPKNAGTGGGEPSATAVSKLAGGENVKMSLYAGPWQEYAENIERLFETFTKEHPNVTIDNIGGTDINALIASGNYPELFVVVGYSPIKPFVEYLTDLTDKKVLWDNVDDSSYSAVTFDGKRYAVPLNVEAYGLVYNKKMFREAGFNEPPRTISDFNKLCGALKDNGITPLGFAFKVDWIANQYLVYPFGWNRDLQDVSQKIINGEVRLLDNYYFKNYKNFVDICLQNAQPKYMEADYTTQLSLLAGEQVAMISNGDWVGQEIAAMNPDIEMGMMGMPFTDDPKDYKIYVNVSNVIGVFKDSKHADVGLAFVEWLITTPSGKNWIGKDWKMLTPVLNTNGDINPLSADGLKATEEGIIGEWGENYLPSEASSVYFVEFQKYMLADTTWDKMVNAMNDEILKYGK